MDFLDDIYLFSQPERTAIAHRALGHQLWTRAGISLHWEDTDLEQEWPMPPGCDCIFARVANPNVVVWKGDQTLRTDKQGVVVLGALLGHAHFITRFLQAKTEEHSVLSTGFLLCKISGARGFCCCFVLPRGPTISFGWCNLIGQSDSLLLTMRTCGIVPRSCWTS